MEQFLPVQMNEESIMINSIVLLYIFIDEDHSVYVSDYKNHRVMKWIKRARQGIVVASSHGQGKRD
jgi:hypothetical protein